LVDLYVADDFLEHDPTDQKGTASVVKILKALAPAASDDVGSTLRNPPVFIVAEGDLVTWLFKQVVTDSKDKSKTAERFSLEVYRIKDRKIIEHWKGAASVP